MQNSNVEQISGTGIEAAFHAMNDLFSEHARSGWAVLLKDAANAFNSLNRQTAL
jgi:hypothetical protein